MTGAPVPAGADRVVPIELTNAGEATVELERDVAAGAHIRRRAEIIAAGQPLLEPGTVLRPSALAWLASHGVSEVEVVAAPRVAFATTGDEVVAPEITPRPGQLRDSHSDFLGAGLAALGIVPERLGILADRREVLDQAIAAGLRNDVLILCGGVSAGAFDFVEPALRDHSCRILVDAVAIQPGKPLVVASGPNGQLIFGLPGNPASVFVTYTVFVRPALERLLGLPPRPPVCVRLGTATPQAARERDRFVPVVLDANGNATPVDARGSHDLSAFAIADGLVRLPRGQRLEKGTVVPLLPW
jgi:molybdopterin molybdotransferase